MIYLLSRDEPARQWWKTRKAAQHVEKVLLKNEAVGPNRTKLIPLFKSECKTDVDNYRSISLLPVLSKVLEKIMYNRLIKFLDKNDKLYEKQFGFRSSI